MEHGPQKALPPAHGSHRVQCGVVDYYRHQRVLLFRRGFIGRSQDVKTSLEAGRSQKFRPQQLLFIIKFSGGESSSLVIISFCGVSTNRPEAFEKRFLQCVKFSALNQNPIELSLR